MATVATSVTVVEGRLPDADALDVRVAELRWRCASLGCALLLSLGCSRKTEQPQPHAQTPRSGPDLMALAARRYDGHCSQAVTR